jgi:hypothetical protein
MMKRTVGFLMVMLSVSLFLPGSGYAQIAKMTPEQPVWGETIQVTYDPKAEGAGFLPGFAHFPGRGSGAKMDRTAKNR